MTAAHRRPRPLLHRRGIALPTVMMLCAALLASLLVSCGSDDPGKEVRGKTPLLAPDPASIAPTVAAVNGFGLDLFRGFGEQHQGNIVLAPYAVAFALGMTRAGAEADTRSQMDQVLRVKPSTDLDRGFATLAQELSSRNGERRSDTRKGTIDIVAASSLWAPRGTKFRDAFLDTLSSAYGAGVRVVDFRSDPDTARSAMNNWARDATDGNVTQLVPRGLLTDQTSLVDASTLTVQAPWLHPFSAELTTPARFTSIDGHVTNPRTMALTAATGVRVAEGEGWQAIELPYLGDQLSMLLVLPSADTFDAFQKSFTSDQLQRIVDRLAPQPADVRLPRFQFETDARLDGDLQGLGMSAAFNDQSADFEQIAENASLSLSAVAHQSYVDVSENGSGTQTGSITVTPPPSAVPPSTVRVSFDHPFFAVVRDQRTGLVLSVARVMNPSA